MRIRWRMPGSFLLFGCLSASACAGAESPRGRAAHALPVPPAASSTHGPSVAGRDAGAASSYADVFDALARDIEAHHAFATGQRARWDAARADLRREVAAATSREAALEALRHVQNALGDRHCYLSPPADLRATRLGLGLDLFADGDGDQARVRVAEVLDLALGGGDDGIAIGDDVVAVDGAPLASWLSAHPWESSSQNESVRRQERANAIASLRLPWAQHKTGDVRVLRFRRGDRTWDRALTFVHPRKWEETRERGFDDAPP